MISDEELFSLMLAVDQNTKRIPPGVRLIADAIYQLGRQHQRESDAALCEKEASGDTRWMDDYERGCVNKALDLAADIRSNTGELK